MKGIYHRASITSTILLLILTKSLGLSQAERGQGDCLLPVTDPRGLFGDSPGREPKILTSFPSSDENCLSECCDHSEGYCNVVVFSQPSNSSNDNSSPQADVDNNCVLYQCSNVRDCRIPIPDSNEDAGVLVFADAAVVLKALFESPGLASTTTAVITFTTAATSHADNAETIAVIFEDKTTLNSVQTTLVSTTESPAENYLDTDTTTATTTPVTSSGPNPPTSATAGAGDEISENSKGDGLAGNSSAAITITPILNFTTPAGLQLPQETVAVTEGPRTTAESTAGNGYPVSSSTTVTQSTSTVTEWQTFSTGPTSTAGEETAESDTTATATTSVTQNIPTTTTVYSAANATSTVYPALQTTTTDINTDPAITDSLPILLPASSTKSPESAVNEGPNSQQPEEMSTTQGVETETSVVTSTATSIVIDFGNDVESQGILGGNTTDSDSSSVGQTSTTALLVSALTLGCFCFFVAVVVVGKGFYSGWKKRQYGRIEKDYLIDGMYRD